MPDTEKALEIAKKLSQLAPMLKSSVYVMELQGAPKKSLHMAIMSKKEDGSGFVGPSWPIGEFLEDLDQLSKALLTEDELMDLSAGGIAAIFGGK